MLKLEVSKEEHTPSIARGGGGVAKKSAMCLLAPSTTIL